MPSRPRSGAKTDADGARPEKFEDVSLTWASDHAVIRLERPERLNALTFPMLAEIRQCIKLCRDNEDVKSVVLCGAGRAFCAGDNLKGMGLTHHKDDALLRVRDESYLSVVRLLRELDKPVITAAHGAGMGAGLELFLAGDIRIATNDARLGMPFVKLGVPAATYELPRLIGLTRAAVMLFGGEPISGSEAATIGLASESVATMESLRKRVAHWTSSFATRSTRSIGLMKRALYQCYQRDADDALVLSTLNFVTAVAAGDRDRGVEEWRLRPKKPSR
jgi:enoyl-CoA hydratase/carnithine racemase